MRDDLPAGRPVTNFLWRYLPEVGGRAIRTDHRSLFSPGSLLDHGRS